MSYLSRNAVLTELYIVYALYGRSRKIALVLAASILIEHALTIPFIVSYFQHIEFNDICISTEISPRMLGIAFVPSTLVMSGADHRLQNPSRSV
jgi:UDP-N-acetylmuramyl pentapeptide phosphotransferase/UDP-N-acetylglucosamine-1-phosphate transferase